MPQAITGGAQNLNAGSTLVTSPAQTASGTEIATMANVQAASLGTGQTWQNVVGSRVSGTTYTNNTGKTIVVSVWSGTGTSCGLSATVGGVAVINTTYNSASVGNIAIVVIVPNGATYAVTANVVGIAGWAELR